MRSLPILAAVFVLTSCATDGPDDRPATVEYIQPAILAPSCATAACHTTATERNGLSFSTIDEACGATRDFLLPAYLIPPGFDGILMPLDSPLPDPDVALIQRFYDDGRPGCP